jgi:DNA-binding LacI/PurR family transcriptional regulator
MMPRTTIDDVARAAGVSVATVSRALRGLPHVAPSTRVVVERVAAELDYEIDPSGSRLATGKTSTIGLVAPWLGTWYTGEVISGAESIFAEAGFDLLVAALPPSSLGPFLGRARSFGRRIDGAVLIDVEVEDCDLDRLADLGVPTVSLGEDLGRYSSVSIDNEDAARRAVDHLLGLGHRRIGTISGRLVNSFTSPVPARRQAGWAAALRTAGIEPDLELVRDGGDSVGGGRGAAAELLDLAEPPTAIFAMSDHMAFGTLAVARERGMKVPGDLSIIGFDDHQFADPFGLTTMRQDVAALGHTVARLVTAEIADPTLDRQHIVLPVELVVRNTTAPPG